jgi:hypothetical protein
MKTALWIILAALPLAFAAPVATHTPAHSKPAMAQVVKKNIKAIKKPHHHAVKRTTHKTHQVAKPTKKP